MQEVTQEDDTNEGGSTFPISDAGFFYPTFHPAWIGSVLPLSWVNLLLAMTIFILPLQFQMLANVIRLYGHISDDYVRRDCDYHRCQEEELEQP